MDSVETQHPHVRFAEAANGKDCAYTEITGVEDQPEDEEPSETVHEAGWLSKPVVQELLQQEMATAIHTIFMPHLSSIENEVSRYTHQVITDV